MRKLITIVLFVCAAWATRHADAQISIGLVSDFQSGTTEGWVSGPFNPNPPTVLLNGHGPGDHVLEVVGLPQGLRAHVLAHKPYRRPMPVFPFYFKALNPDLAAPLATGDGWYVTAFDGDTALL